MSPLTKSLIEELQRAPESVQLEVLAIIRRRAAELEAGLQPDDTGNLSLLAESAWKADWDTAAEDEAWRDL